MNNLTINGSIKSNSININSVNTGNSNNKTLYIADIDDSNTTNINIGSGNNKKQVTIGTNSSSVTLGKSSNSVDIGNPTDNTKSTNIKIGGDADSVTINGVLKLPAGTVFVNQIIQYSPTVTLNIDQSGSQYIATNQGVQVNDASYSSTPGAGIQINDFSNQTMGLMVVTRDIQGFLFKAPTYVYKTDYLLEGSSNLYPNLLYPSQNTVRFDVNKLTLPSTIYGSGSSGSGSGLVILTGMSPDADGSRYKITGSNIDIGNIFLKDLNPIINKVITTNTQSVSTNVTINGLFTVYNDTQIYSGNLKVYNNAIINNLLINTNNDIANANLTMSGNAIISRLGIGTSSVNTDLNASLEIFGNVYQKNGGFIYQF